MLKTTKQPLTLREYQIPAVLFAMENDLVVLGMAPNAGKTEISIEIIQRYLNLHPKAKVLVLTHSTTVLRANYMDRLDSIDVTFTYSDNFNPKAQVHVCLPQTIKRIKGSYDLLIVDEAHENYLAQQVQKIVENTTPKKQVLLTGTPSVFIKKGGYSLYPLAINSIPQEYFAKLNIELVASKYNWSNQIDSKYEIKSSYNFLKKDTEATLEAIILKLIERVKKKIKAEEFNNPSFLTKIKSWAFTYNKLGKTLIPCRSVKQANDVYEILLKNGVNAGVSHSDGDTDSSELVKFKNGEFDVLVVVDRARLGYSDDNLCNIIDMSGTHNPNLINQMFSRVLRGTPDMEKYYLKVTTQQYGFMDFTHACVCGALMLTDNKFLSTFNGSNFNGMLIPVIKQAKSGGGSSGGGSVGKKTSKKFILPEFTIDVIDLFRNIIHDLDNPVSIYKTTTIREYRAVLSGMERWTEERIFASARGEI